ncbi:MAG: HupE/UreJ family protein [Vicinamibacteraceae bacterium]
MTRGRRALAALAFAIALLASAERAVAHPAPFSFLDLRIDAGRVDGSLTVHDLDAAHELGLPDIAALLDPAASARHGAALGEILSRRLRILVDGHSVAVTLTDMASVPDRQSVRFSLTLSGAASGRPGRLAVDATLFPYDRQHQTFVNVYEDGTLRHQAILDARRSAMDYYAGSWPGVAAVLATFVAAGIHHIAIGPDHILFLVGLLLLGGSMGRLGLIVTAFTIGHSITLSLAALNVLAPPGSVIEPAIALSLVLVGADNLLAGDHQTNQRRDLRAPMAGLFGLVHGFGFAAVLREFGLPQAAIGWSLFGFNLGVELGQLLLVVPLALILAAVRRQRPMVARRIAMVGSVVVALAGAFWFVQRVFFPEGIA